MAKTDVITISKSDIIEHLIENDEIDMMEVVTGLADEIDLSILADHIDLDDLAKKVFELAKEEIGPQIDALQDQITKLRIEIGELQAQQHRTKNSLLVAIAALDQAVRS